MKKVMFFLCILALAGFVSAVGAYNNLHINIQTTYSNGSIDTGTFAFVFNISNSSNCAAANVVYSNSTSLTTDARGIISYYLENVNLDYKNQYWLCYYKNGALADTTELAKVPYAFSAKNVTLSGVEVDTSLNTGIYNISTTTGWFNGLFKWLIGAGSRYLSFNGTTLNFSESALNATIDSRIGSGGGGAITGAGTQWYIPLWSSATSLNNSVIYQSGSNIGIGTTTPQNKLNVKGIGNFTLSLFSYGRNLSKGYDYAINSTGTGFLTWANAINGTLALNSTTGSYVIAKNNSLGAYVRAKNNSLGSYVIAKNNSLASWVLAKGYSTGSEGISWANAVNGTLAFNSTFGSYVIAKNNSLGVYVRAKNNSLGSWVLAKGYSVNSTIASYIVAKNNSLGAYVRAKNNSLGSYVIAKNNSLGTYVRAKNNSMGSYVIAKNNSLASWVSGNFLENTGDTATGNYTFDTSTLFIDSVNNRVGIGTTSPTTALQIGEGALASFSTTPDKRVQLSSTTNGDELAYTMYSNEGTNQMRTKWFLDDTTSLTGFDITASSGVPDFQITMGALTPFFIDSVTGKVGIGTTSPSVLLDVNGSGTSAYTQLFLQGTSAGSIELRDTGAGVDDKSMVLRDENGVTKFFSINDARSAAVVNNILTMDHSSGKVGIGTTTPSHKLNVVGDLNVTGTIYGNAQVIAGSSGNTWNRSGTNVFLANTGDSVGIGTTSPQDLLHLSKAGGGANIRLENPDTIISSSENYGNISWVGQDLGGSGIRAMISVSADVPTSTDGQTRMSFYTASNGADALAERMVIDKTGNVGIGTTAPGYKLDVSGQLGILASETLTDINFYGGYAANIVSDNAIYIKTGGSSHTLHFGTAANSEMVLKAGSVGIGTTGPNSNLEIAGSNAKPAAGYWLAQIRDTTSAAAGVGGGLEFTGYKTGTSAQGLFAAIDGQKESATAAEEKGKLSLWTNDGTQLQKRLTIDSSGNVGIGTTSPVNKLDIISGADDLNNGGALRIRPSDHLTYGGYLVINKNSGDNSYATIQNGDTSSYLPLALNPNGGNVGIGTTSPEVPLHIYKGDSGGASRTGDALFTLEDDTNIALQFLVPNTNYNAILFGDADDNDVGQILYYHNGNKMGFRTNAAASDAVTIDSSGNVGIGTTTPYSGTAVTSLTINATSYPTLALQVGGSTKGTLSAVSSRIHLTTPDTNSLILQENGGKVGIGTTSPGTKLDILDNSGPYTRFTSLTNAAFEDMGGLQWFSTSDTTGVASSINVVRGGSNYVEGHLIFNTSSNNNNQERMRITSTGNVGIGTTSPSTRLYVNETTSGVVSTLTLDNSVASNRGSGISFKQGGTQRGTVGISGLIEGSTDGNMSIFSENSIKFFTGGSGTAKGIWDSTGNVGIGTTSPGSLLELYGDDKYLSLNFPTSTSYNYIGFKENGVLRSYIQHIGSGFATSARRNDLELESSYGNIILNSISGNNVGIGTTSPATLLDISGAANTLLTLEDTITGGTSLIKFETGGSSRGYIGYTTLGDDGLAFINGAGNTANLLVTYDGNVGIGTMSPDSLLSVGGRGIIGAGVYGNGTSTVGTNYGGYFVASGSFGVDYGVWAESDSYGVYASGGTNDFHASNGKYYLGAAPTTANTETLCWDGSGASFITDCTSSIRWKKNVEDFSLGLDTLMKLNPRVFQWKDDNHTDVGLIAEEVAEVAPSLVKYSVSANFNGTEPSGIRFETALPALLINSMQELKTENDLLKSELCARDSTYSFCADLGKEKEEKETQEYLGMDLTKQETFYRYPDKNESVE